MRYRGGIFLIFIVTFAIFKCSETTNNSGIKPGSVQFVSRSSDTAPYEKGIDAIPESDAIYIEWRSSEDPTVTGYHLYRSNKEGSVFQLIGQTNAPDDTSWIDESVGLSMRYYYYIVSVNEDDTESAPSDTIDYLLLDKVTYLNPNGIISESNPSLKWAEPSIVPKGYIVKVKEKDEESFIWIYSLDQTEIDYGGHQSIEYNKDGKALIQSLQKGKSYQWRIDKQGGSNSGSESHWANITIQ